MVSCCLVSNTPPSIVFDGNTKMGDADVDLLAGHGLIEDSSG